MMYFFYPSSASSSSFIDSHGSFTPVWVSLIAQSSPLSLHLWSAFSFPLVAFVKFRCTLCDVLSSCRPALLFFSLSPLLRYTRDGTVFLAYPYARFPPTNTTPLLPRTVVPHRRESLVALSQPYLFFLGTLLSLCSERSSSSSYRRPFLRDHQ